MSQCTEWLRITNAEVSELSPLHAVLALLMVKANGATCNRSLTADILGPDGAVARRMERLRASAAAASDGRGGRRSRSAALGITWSLEAGTGVGKSFAYLVPAILAATEPVASQPQAAASGSNSEESKPKKQRRVVVSTHTIASAGTTASSKDLPLLEQRSFRASSRPFWSRDAATTSSLRRLEAAQSRKKSLFDALRSRSTSSRELFELKKWSEDRLPTVR